MPISPLISAPLKVDDIFLWNDAWKIKEIVSDNVLYLGESYDFSTSAHNQTELRLKLSGMYFQVTNLSSPENSVAISYDQYLDELSHPKKRIILHFNKLTQPRPQAIITPRQQAEEYIAQHQRRKKINDSGFTIVK